MALFTAGNTEGRKTNNNLARISVDPLKSWPEKSDQASIQKANMRILNLRVLCGLWTEQINCETLCK